MPILGLCKDTFSGRFILTSAFLALMVTAHAQNGQRDAANAIEGTWIVKSIYDTHNVEGPSPAEQKKLVGSEIVYGRRILKSCGQSVPISSIHQHRIGSADFLANTLVPLAEIGIHAESVMEVVINDRQTGSCFDAFPLPGQDIFLKNKDEMAIEFEGVFYRLVRKR